MERRFDVLSDEWRSFVTIPAARVSPVFDDNSSCAICRSGPGGTGMGLLQETKSGIAVLDQLIAPRIADPWTSVPDRPLTPVLPAANPSELVVWSDDHDVALADLPIARLAGMIEVWAERFAELGARTGVAYVLIVEEKRPCDAWMEHPHAVVWTYSEIPARVERDLQIARRYMDDNGRCLRCDVGAHAAAGKALIVASDARMLAFVPFAARFPYEVHVQSRRHATTLLDLSDNERVSLASVLHQVVAAYDRLSGHPTPYALALRQAPTDNGDWLAVSHLHIEIAPWLDPEAVGGNETFGRASELFDGEYVNAVPPERSAAALRGDSTSLFNHSL
jgi:UDPglucose--hexose-1-phosphate uridylyltransferase